MNLVFEIVKSNVHEVLVEYNLIDEDVCEYFIEKTLNIINKNYNNHSGFEKDKEIIIKQIVRGLMVI